MALSQDEQRALAEIERRLVADDPGLASCLTTFRRPGPATVLRSPRARIIGSLFTVLLVAMVSLMVYAMIPFRAHMLRHTLPPASASAPASLSVVTSTKPEGAQQSSTGASTSEKAATSQSSQASQGTTNHSATATGRAQQKIKPSTQAGP